MANELGRFEEKVDKSGECWHWTGALDRSGYGLFRFNNRWGLAHRASFVLANGAIPKGMQVLHHCDNPPCVNPAHLWLGTNRDNTRDSCAKGRRRGRSPQMGWQKAQVLRAEHAKGAVMADLMRLYGVRNGALRSLIAGRTWNPHRRLQASL